ncbi:hypothetical protein psyc5s11_24280 [Clostridium gelidum]|uniref:GGDEF domain-containing protein n=2 Tax=Clostridium gelidum TaxID=704125 RepID=A0ABM7T3Y4_9CLOT|nr:hypothetical protein psyc5s11_24280 [Clostridium gelidum]
MLLALLMSAIGTFIDENFDESSLRTIVENIFYLSTYVLIIIGFKKGIKRIHNYIKIKIRTIILNFLDIVIFFFLSLIIFCFFDKEMLKNLFSFNITLDCYFNFIYPILDSFILLYFTFSQRIFSTSNKNKSYIYFYVGVMIRIISDFIDIFEIGYSNNIYSVNLWISSVGIFIIIYALYYIKSHEMQLKYSAFNIVEYNDEMITGFNYSTVFVLITYLTIYIYYNILKFSQVYYNDTYNDFIIMCGIIMLGIQSIKQLVIIYSYQSQVSDLEKKATKDYLTNAYNRSYTFKLLNNLFIYYQNNNLELSVLMLDIDFFKKINDKYGHSYGDFVLVNIVKIINMCILENGIVCRHGGEEFLVILPNYSMDKAFILSNEIREAVQNYEFEYKNNEIVKVTISIGGETMNSTTEDEIDLVDNADKALYDAKKTRNLCKWYLE